MKTSVTGLFVNYGRRPIGFAILVMAAIVPLRAQKTIGKCEVRQPYRVKYDLVFEHENSLPPKMLMVDIVVAPTNYNVDYMTRLARTLVTRYCNRDHLSVAIFDDKRAAKDTNMLEFLRGRIEAPAVRGFFFIDREKKQARITFSEKRGDPTDQIKIDVPLP
jgi:hypothetical protein